MELEELAESPPEQCGCPGNDELCEGPRDPAPAWVDPYEV